MRLFLLASVALVLWTDAQSVNNQSTSNMASVRLSSEKLLASNYSLIAKPTAPVGPPVEDWYTSHSVDVPTRSFFTDNSTLSSPVQIHPVSDRYQFDYIEKMFNLDHSDEYLNGTDDHTLLLQTMRAITNSLTDLGVVGKCSQFKRRDIENSTVEMIDHVALKISPITRKKNDRVSWREKSHPVSKMLHKIFDETLSRRPACKANKDFSSIALLRFDKIIARLDPNLRKFLAQKVFTLHKYVGHDERLVMHKLLPLIQHYCTQTLEIEGEELMSCTKDLTRLMKIVVGQDSGSPTEGIRIKRFTEELNTDSIVTNVNRDGYGYDGYSDDGYGGGGGYKASPNYIVVPDGEDSKNYDHGYAVLVGILTALAVATYGFLGLLSFYAFASSISSFTGGPPGPKGDKGPKGSKGLLGMDGMAGMAGDSGDSLDGPKGDKGMKGLLGDDGPIGDDGMIGDTGDGGEGGEKGFKGFKGFKGAKGFKGEDGEKGFKGMKGFKGLKGKCSGNCGRKKRRVTGNENYLNLLDSPNLLDIIYKTFDEPKRPVGEVQDADVVDAINSIWREHQSPMGCTKCNLFDFLEGQEFASLDPYIIAGFSHILGNSDSLQLLDNVREGHRQGMKMRCQRRETTCQIERLSDIVY